MPFPPHFSIDEKFARSHPPARWHPALRAATQQAEPQTPTQHDEVSPEETLRGETFAEESLRQVILRAEILGADILGSETLGGAALQRCGNRIGLSPALAAEVLHSAQEP